jgi:hypothetical protein
MMFCIAMDNAHCPEGNDWSMALIVIVLILAIAGYSAFKLWVNRNKGG